MPACSLKSWNSPLATLEPKFQLPVEHAVAPAIDPPSKILHCRAIGEPESYDAFPSEVDANLFVAAELQTVEHIGSAQ